MASRPQRWTNALEHARTAIDTAKQELEDAFNDLQALQSEYADWLDNLPDMSRGSALEEKLSAMADLNLEIDTDVFSDIEDRLDDADNADLPLGFGRD